ncbi:hypothetical protein BV25DRAFT_1871044 [Artomyces pyxidatus]|uniref:Uncharacterized protein n=1 Tax=Artomyces pyxidatus TaxID=48021 RepID=A0ACB8SYE7_9AGAM|nr:hypothetical protein BV25DRAFT_1871044 [Artomyces pyxidatus]
MTMHPVSYPGMPMHMYPFAPGMVPSQPQIRSKRRQVKNACTNCQKACKKCDDARPCLRCVKYGIGEECVDSQRKERKKGIKRGPYKKRDGKTTSVEQPLDVPPPQQGIPMPQGVPAASPPPPVPYMGSVGYPPGFYGQYAPMPPAPKPGETAYYPHPQFYVPVQHAPPPPPPGQDPENVQYGQPPPQFYAGPFMPQYAPQYGAPYMMPHPRPDQMQMANAQYYAPPPPPPPGMYPKPPPGHPGADVGSMHMGGGGGGGGGRRPEHGEGREMVGVGMDGRPV